MKGQLICILIVSLFLVSSFSQIVSFANDGNDRIPTIHELKDETVKTMTVTYPNSDMSVLWIRKNGSDPGFDYGGANVNPSVGMNYFDTNVLQVSWGYSWSEINDTSLFPTNCEIYRQIDCVYAEASSVANHSLYDSRIKGAWIDDFQVSLQSPSNMSNIHSVLHAQNLTLGIVVYNRNYYDQSPYTWDDISAYIDIIHYWFYPNTYGLLYPQFAGYEDDFRTFQSWLPDTMEYWLGIYLHYYNAGSYPLDFTYEQLAIAGKLIKMGDVTRLSILENFWIQHNSETAELVRDFINEEIQSDYASTWFFNSLTVTSTEGTTPLYPALVDTIYFLDYSVPEDAEYDTVPFYLSEPGYLDSFQFTSHALQNLTIRDMDDYYSFGNIPYYMLTNIKNGKTQFPYFDDTNTRVSYILEPEETYRLQYARMTTVYINGTWDVDAPVSWSYKHIIVNGVINLNSSLNLNNSILQFGNNHYVNSMYNFTKPSFGIKIWPVTTAAIRCIDTIIEPVNRAFPYFFERKDNAYVGTAGTGDNFKFVRSIVACHTNMTRPSGEVLILKSTFFQVQPIGSTYNYLLFLQAPSRNTKIVIQQSMFVNYDVGGSVGVFLMNYNLHTSAIKEFRFNSVLFDGGRYGLWVDMSLTDTGLTFENITTNNDAYTDLFVDFRIDGTADKEVIIETSSIFVWCVKTAVTGPTLRMYWPYLENGLYTLTIDDTDTLVAVTTHTFVLTYVGPWLTYRNNFSLLLYGAMPDTEETITNIIWLLVIFIIPIAMCQTLPKIGFIVGMPVSLLLFSGADTTLIPYMIVGMIAVITYVYKGD